MSAADTAKTFRSAQFWEEDTATLLDIVNVLGRWESCNEWAERTEFSVVTVTRDETMAQGATLERYAYAQRVGAAERVALLQNAPKLPFRDESLAASVGRTVEQMNAMPVSAAAAGIVYDALAESKSGIVPRETIDKRVQRWRTAEGGLDDGALPADFRLSLTATPDLYTARPEQITVAGAKLDDSNALRLRRKRREQAVERPDRRSNDDEELFGPCIFNFTTAQSVEAGRGRFVTRGLGPFVAWCLGRRGLRHEPPSCPAAQADRARQAVRARRHRAPARPLAGGARRGAARVGGRSPGRLPGHARGDRAGRASRLRRAGAESRLHLPLAQPPRRRLCGCGPGSLCGARRC